jgi:hypothetical protein
MTLSFAHTLQVNNQYMAVWRPTPRMSIAWLCNQWLPGYILLNLYATVLSHATPPIFQVTLELQTGKAGRAVLVRLLLVRPRKYHLPLASTPQCIP